jgi:hypothetical protein
MKNCAHARKKFWALRPSNLTAQVLLLLLPCKRAWQALRAVAMEGERE